MQKHDHSSSRVPRSHHLLDLQHMKHWVLQFSKSRYCVSVSVLKLIMLYYLISKRWVNFNYGS